MNQNIHTQLHYVIARIIWKSIPQTLFNFLSKMMNMEINTRKRKQKEKERKKEKNK